MSLPKRIILLLAILILIYCLWNGRELFQAWIQTSYFEHYSWILFILWCLPLIYYFVLKKSSDRPNSILMGMALFFSLAGNLGELHTFEYIGIALSLAAFIPWLTLNIVWIIASFLWMPGSSWIATHLALHYIDFLFAFRLFFISLVSFCVIVSLSKIVK